MTHKQESNTLDGLLSPVTSAADSSAQGLVRGLAPVVVLHRAALAFNATLDLPDVLQAVMDEVQAVMPAGVCSVWLAEPDTGDAVCQVVQGTGHPLVPGRRVPAGQGVVGRTVSRGSTIQVADAISGSAYDDDPRHLGSEVSSSLLCVPLRLRTSVTQVGTGGGETTTLGAILVSGCTAGALADDAVTLLEALAASAAVAIENARLYRQAEREIADRRRAEHALRYSESQYRTLVETSPDAIVVTGPQGIITMCNRRAAELHGYERTSELLGKSFLILFAPSSRAPILALHRRALEGHVISEQELTLMRRDGSYFEAEYAASLIAGSNKDSVSVVGFARDITDRREAENTIRRHNQELRILNAIATGTSQAHDVQQILDVAIGHALRAFHVDTGWGVIFDHGCSEPAHVQTTRGGAAVSDLTPDQIPLYDWLRDRVCSSGKPLLVSTSDLSSEWIAEGSLCQVAAAPLLAQGRVIGIVAVLGISGGQPHTVRFQQVQLLSAIGHQVGIAIENARLSEKVSEIAMLRELDAMRSQLIASFSHDLRSPLGLIKMACSTLQRDDVTLGAALVKDMLQEIQLQTDRLTRLVDDILDLGRLESGHLALRRTQIDLGELLCDLAAEIERLHHGYHLALDVTTEGSTAWADPNRIEQVLRNLLDNALKYTPQPSELVAQVRRHQHRLYVSISDQGIGIPADKRELVFERFYRVDNDATHHIAGAGLGLAMCRGIVEAHGGQIWIEDSSERALKAGHGTTVVFTLPAAPGSLPGAEPTLKPGREAPG